LSYGRICCSCEDVPAGVWNTPSMQLKLPKKTLAFNLKVDALLCTRGAPQPVGGKCEAEDEK